MKACSFCAEEIQDAAIVCKHCGRDLLGQRPKPTIVRNDIGPIAKWALALFALWILAGLFYTACNGL